MINISLYTHSIVIIAHLVESGKLLRTIKRTKLPLFSDIITILKLTFSLKVLETFSGFPVAFVGLKLKSCLDFSCDLVCLMKFEFLA